MPSPPVNFHERDDLKVVIKKLQLVIDDLYSRLLVQTNIDRPFLYDDFRIPTTATKFAGANDPDFTAFRGTTRVSWFAAGADEELFFVAQFPHAMKTGTNLIPHVHWCPSDTGSGNVVWALEYTWADIGQVFQTNTTTISVTAPAGGIAYKHLLTDLPEIDGSFINRVSSILVGRVYRDADNASDTYGSDAGLLEFDFHIKIDSLGSRQVTAK